MWALAVMRDTSKMIAIGRAAPAFSKAQVQVYSPAGEPILLFSVDTPLPRIPVCVLTSYCSGTRARSSALAGREMNGSWSSTKRVSTVSMTCKENTNNTPLVMRPERWASSTHGYTKLVSSP